MPNPLSPPPPDRDFKSAARRVAFEDLSLPVQEIVGRTPHWLLRSGSMAIAGGLSALLLLGFIIRYPDVIASRITLTGVNPPVAVVARNSGNLQSLMVKENDRVKKGALLGVIANSAEPSRVFRLREELEKLRPFLSDPNAFTRLNLGAETQLGSIQTAYAEFHINYHEYQTRLTNDFTDKTLSLLRRQLDQKRAQIADMREQVANVEREVGLAREGFERTEKLHRDDLVSKSVLQTEERALLELQRQQSTIAKTLTTEEIATTESEKQIHDWTHQRSEELRTLRATLAESLKKLFAAIDQWETDFVLRAPTDGKVAFYDFWSAQQFVTTGKEVFVIVPETTHLLGRVQVMAGGVGKITPGQTVRIKFDDFPHKEFGIVNGTVEAVSLVARQGQHMVTVNVASPLVTHYGKTLPFKQEMTRDAAIITDDRRLIGRLFNEFRR